MAGNAFGLNPRPLCGLAKDGAISGATRASPSRRGCARKAAEGLEESAGIRSRTLASWELSWKRGYDTLRRRDVFVIDEAPSMRFSHVEAASTRVSAFGRGYFSISGYFW
jgi:hypothetical protein